MVAMRSIRDLREERGWTQLEVAIQLGVTPLTVGNWERNVTEPRASQLRALARLYGVSMDDLLIPAIDLPDDKS